MKTFIANWKMNLGVSESIALAKDVVREVGTLERAPRVVLAATDLAVPSLLDAVNGSHVRVAVQDVSEHHVGAFTGQTAAETAKEAGAHMAIIGHSERRQYQEETDETISHKLRQALRQRLDVVVCVGEPHEVRVAGETVSFVNAQLKTIFDGVEVPPSAFVAVAYEPLWAIGTGLVPSVHDVETEHKMIRSCLQNLDISDVQVLYGGSVKAHNARGFLEDDDVDGVLVGGASNSKESLLELIRITADYV